MKKILGNAIENEIEGLVKNITWEELKNIKDAYKLFEKEKVNKAITDSYKEFFIKIIPICIMAVVFALINWMPISSFGMTMFWGIVLIAVYDFVITSSILKIKADK